MSTFKGKVAIITGSSHGIGAAIAQKLASLGANCVITGRDEKRIETVVNKCNELSGSDTRTALGVRADLLVANDLKNLVDKTVKQFGRIDILVNCAGFEQSVNLTDSADDYFAAYDKVMATNARSVQVLSRLVVPYLLANNNQGSAILNISSTLSLIPDPTTIPYCMSKCALDMFTKCLALELGPKGVRVNAINPGAIRTPRDEETDKFLVDHCQKSYPLKRIGEVEDIAETAAFLCSSAASFITGVVLAVDGGAMLCGLP
ncbi:glucose 1-dehydrogenase 1-like [Oppia nitens]|uniref:glucose 1-dehydrogenase 1-like n=1 Tax=Oppia nitens TaxID=1686743 RepID=UPI0023DCD009|nr:glucose 1-dehydrogenase 1-like [Oppia nitens]